jgi:hypothetical protein
MAAAEPTKVLYRSRPPPRGASAFVVASSCALAGSPLWAPFLLGWLGYRAARSTGSTDRPLPRPSVAAQLWAAVTGLHQAPAIAEGSGDLGGGLDALREWDRQRAATQRQWGIFFLSLVLAYLPVRRWKAFHQSPAWERLWCEASPFSQKPRLVSPLVRNSTVFSKPPSGERISHEPTLADAKVSALHLTVVRFGRQGVSAVGPARLPSYASQRQVMYAVVPHGIFPFGLGLAMLGPLRSAVFHMVRS